MNPPSFTQDTIEFINNHARIERSYEVCGLIGGYSGVATRAIPVHNSNKSATSFYMTSEHIQEGLELLRELDLKWVGIYHSHVYDGANPSIEDLSDLTNLFYLLVSPMYAENNLCLYYKKGHELVITKKINII